MTLTGIIPKFNVSTGVLLLFSVAAICQIAVHFTSPTASKLECPASVALQHPEPQEAFSLPVVAGKEELVTDDRVEDSVVSKPAVKKVVNSDGVNKNCGTIVYANFGFGIYEDHSLFETYLAKIGLDVSQGGCECTIELRVRESFAEEIQSPEKFGLYRVNYVIYAGISGLHGHEVEAVKNAPREFVKEKLIVFHYSDERGGHDASFYDLVRRVYRNHWTEWRQGQLNYLLNIEDSSSDSNVFWSPLWYSFNFIPMKTLYRKPTYERKYEYAFAGSTDDRWERQGEFQPAISGMDQSKAKIEIFGGFGQNKLSRLEYTAMMHETMLSPCPSGNNPEQFRIWESFLGGAVPVILNRHTAVSLHPHVALGLKFAIIENWSDFPQLVADMMNNASQVHTDIPEFQANNFKVIDTVVDNLQTHITNLVCYNK